MLGSGLLAFVPALVAGLIVETTGLHLDWRLWVLGFLIGMIAAAMWAGAAALFNGASWGVSAFAIFGIIYSFYGSILVGTHSHFPFPFIIFLLYGTIGGLSRGKSGGLFNIVKLGKPLSAAMIVENMAVYILVAGVLSESIVVGMMTGLTYLLGTRLGHIWATRQVPDEETRKLLTHSTNTDNLF